MSFVSQYLVQYIILSWLAHGNTIMILVKDRCPRNGLNLSSKLVYNILSTDRSCFVSPHNPFQLHSIHPNSYPVSTLVSSRVDELLATPHIEAPKSLSNVSINKPNPSSSSKKKAVFVSRRIIRHGNDPIGSPPTIVPPRWPQLSRVSTRRTCA